MKNKKNDFLLEKITEDVRELESYIKELSIFLPLPVCLVTPANSIIDINNAFKRLSGYDEIDIIGQQVDFLFKDKEKIKNFLIELFQRGTVKNKEIEFIVKRGNTIIVNFSAALRKDTNKNIVGYFLALADITDLKKLQNSLEDKVKERTEELEKVQKVLVDTLDEVKAAKRKIEKERNKTAAIISNFSDPVIVVDNEWQIMLFNPAAKKIFHLSDKNLAQRIISKDNRFSFNDFKKVINIDFEVKELETDEDNKPIIEEVVLYSKSKPAKDISPFSVTTSKYEEGDLVYKVITVPVYDKDICFGHMKIFYDLTREKMIDKLKSEFISIAAHQLRTPLSAIKWSIKMTLDGDVGKLNKEQKNILLKGYASNERVINLINDMLSVSRIEEGRFGYSFAKDNFEDVLDVILKNFDSQIKSKNIKFIVQKPKKLPTIYMDKERIILAMQILLENAVKYTPEFGKIVLNININKKLLEVKMKDNGIGIPQQEQTKLFSKFFRGTNVVRMQAEGSGLGLFIVKNVIDKHSGKTFVASEEGKGTEIGFTLPIN